MHNVIKTSPEGNLSTTWVCQGCGWTTDNFGPWEGNEKALRIQHLEFALQRLEAYVLSMEPTNA